VQNAFDENGYPGEKDKTYKRAKTFLDEFFWFVEVRKDGQLLSMLPD
jgi:hypothetical protein